jgi:hypothetical protein
VFPKKIGKLKNDEKIIFSYFTGAGGSIQSKCTKSSMPSFFNCKITVPVKQKLLGLFRRKA